MPTIIDGSTGVTFPAGGVGNPAGTVVGTTDTQTLTNKTISVSQLSGTTSEANGGTGTTTGYYGFKNRIINGAMVIDQRNAGASVTPGTSGSYLVDRWTYSASQASKFTAQQTPSATETGYATRVSAGFTNYLAFTVASSVSIGAGDYFLTWQKIEGLNIADLAWGTSGAKTVTLSFLVYSSLTGTFGGAITNSAQNRSYPFTYTISSANTWTTISVTVAGDTSGTWLTTTGVGIAVFFGLGVGSTYSGTAGAWAGSTYYSATGATSVVGTNGATFYITGVQLEKGSTATSFDYRPYGTELALCQRYCHAYSSYSLGRARDGDTVYGGGVTLSPTMRATPTLRSGATFTANTGSAGTPQILSTAGSASSPDNVYVNSSTSSWTTNALIALTNAVFEAEL